MNFLLVLIALLLVIAVIFKIIVIIGALTRNKESVSGWVSRLYTPNYKPYKKMEKDKKDQLHYQFFNTPSECIEHRNKYIEGKLKFFEDQWKATERNLKKRIIK